jgi:CubicO group peptidase (beta-lactamase class C family)
MRRRPFLQGSIAVVATHAAAPAARAAEAHPGARVGLVEAGSARANQHLVDAFLAGLREQGYVPGRSVAVDARWAEGRAESRHTQVAISPGCGPLPRRARSAPTPCSR